ncbi:MAG: hypothetical protein IJ786_01270 [Bacteroidaceae bacterium]|nr:hypothetical protein [Bacteroidaceae bacterium]
MNVKPRNRYITPSWQLRSLAPESHLLSPSAHNEMGDPIELTRRQEWWDNDASEDDEEEQ